MSASVPIEQPRRSESLLIPIPQSGIIPKDADSLLQLLAITAYWGKASQTGQELWAEFRRSTETAHVTTIDDATIKDRSIKELNARDLNADKMRETVAAVEAQLENPTETALQIASQASSSSRAYRLERLRQARLIFVLTFSSVIVGVVLMIVGVFVHLNMIAVGAFVEFISGVLVLLYRRSTRQLDTEAEVSHELERLRLGIALIREIKDTTVRDQALRSLIRDVHDHPTTVAVDKHRVEAPGRAEHDVERRP